MLRAARGWAMATHPQSELVLETLDEGAASAPARGRDPSFGPPHTACAFGRRCEERGVWPSQGAVGDCYERRMVESFFATAE